VNGWFDAGKTQLLNDSKGLHRDLLKYDKRNMEEKMINEAKKIIESEDFTEAKVKSASAALVAILEFAKGMCEFYDVLKIVVPKEAKVQEMN
jgi:hypothetical protein